MANVLRLESNHKEALVHMSYVYVVAYKSENPRATLEKNLKSYFNRVDKTKDFERFKGLLEKLNPYDYQNTQQFIHFYFVI